MVAHDTATRQPSWGGGARHWLGAAGGLLGVLVGGMGLYEGLTARRLVTQMHHRTAALEQRVAQATDEAGRVSAELRSLENRMSHALAGLAPPAPLPPAPSPPSAAPAPTSPPAEATPTAGASVYTVQAGDTFQQIARAHGLTIRALAQANPGVQARRLQIGQRLLLPAGSP